MGAVSRCLRVQNASIYHILDAVSEEPARISRSCLAGSEGSCGPATTLQAVWPRSARLMATCELKTRPSRLLSYAGRFLPCGSAACQPPETTASHRYTSVELAHLAKLPARCVASTNLRRIWHSRSKSHAKEAPRSFGRAQTRPELAAATRHLRQHSCRAW